MRLNVRARGLEQLKALRNALRDPGPMLDNLGKNLAEEAVDLVIQGFQAQANPYREPWAPKKMPDGRAILTGKTSRLRRGWNRPAKKIGRYKWRIAPSVDYATYHQRGTKNKDGSVRMVARKMIPDERGLPSEWQEAFRETAVEFMRAHFSGVGIRAQKKAHFR
jgi:hypothetical protein